MEEEKAKHDQCFQVWMKEKFLPGKATKDDCLDLYNEYNTCVELKLRAMGLDYLKKMLLPNNNQICIRCIFYCTKLTTKYTILVVSIL